jgi:hypothetical protein
MSGLKYYGPINDPDDLVTKNYVDTIVSEIPHTGSVFEFDENNDLMPLAPQA